MNYYQIIQKRKSFICFMNFNYCDSISRFIFQICFFKYFCLCKKIMFLPDSPASSHSGSLSDMSAESNGSLSKNEHRTLDFKLIVDDVKSGQQVMQKYKIILAYFLYFVIRQVYLSYNYFDKQCDLEKKCNLGGALDLPRPILEVKSAPKIKLQSNSGSIFYITDMPRNFSPCPDVYLHF